MRNITYLLLFLIGCGGQEITIKSTPSDADIFIKVLGKEAIQWIQHLNALIRQSGTLYGA